MESIIKLHMNPSQVRGYQVNKNTTEETLNTLGVYAMDSLPASITTPSIMTPLQFLQYFYPKAIETVTAARKIDDLIGRDVVASWEQEEVVTPVVERLGMARPYGDFNSTVFSSVNVNYERRTIMRFEDGIQVNQLEEARASKTKINIAELKRNAAIEALAIELNRLGFYGYNDGENRTYGFLNDPNLPAYISVASNSGNTSTQWKNKTFLEITNDIRTAFAALLVKSGGNFDPVADESTLALSLSCQEYLSITNELGTTSVQEWLNKTYPRCRVVSAPELDAANGGANVFYLYANRIKDNDVWAQMVVTTLRSLGVERTIKGYAEAYSNATAGVILKSPIGIVRYTGI